MGAMGVRWSKRHGVNLCDIAIQKIEPQGFVFGQIAWGGFISTNKGVSMGETYFMSKQWSSALKLKKSCYGVMFLFPVFPKSSKAENGSRFLYWWLWETEKG